jgi:hypothetical protein
MNARLLPRLIPAVMAACVLATPALASVVVWKDPVQGFSMSYPDSWTVQTPDTPHTALRVAGPLGEDLATCRMKVMEDGRAKIYPKENIDKIVSRELDPDFWAGEVAQYDNAKITEFFDPASMGGKGDATGVRVAFYVNDGQKMAPMYGIMLGSIYGGKRFLASCASRAESFERWSSLFGSILDSVDLGQRYHPFATGYYRDFIADPKLKLPRSKPGTINVPEERTFMQKVHDFFYPAIGKYHQ